MNSNFQFLKNEFATFHDRAVKAEQHVITDPRTSLVYSRMALEVGTVDVCKRRGAGVTTRYLTA